MVAVVEAALMRRESVFKIVGKHIVYYVVAAGQLVEIVRHPVGVLEVVVEIVVQFQKLVFAQWLGVGHAGAEALVDTLLK